MGHLSQDRPAALPFLRVSKHDASSVMDHCPARSCQKPLQKQVERLSIRRRGMPNVHLGPRRGERSRQIGAPVHARHALRPPAVSSGDPWSKGGRWVVSSRQGARPVLCGPGCEAPPRRAGRRCGRWRSSASPASARGAGADDTAAGVQRGSRWPPSAPVICEPPRKIKSQRGWRAGLESARLETFSRPPRPVRRVDLMFGRAERPRQSPGPHRWQCAVRLCGRNRTTLGQLFRE